MLSLVNAEFHHAGERFFVFVGVWFNMSLYSLCGGSDLIGV